MASKKAKLEGLFGWRMRVVLNDGRNIIGRFMAFDRHMNLVLGESEEYRLIKPKKGKKEDVREEKRHLGLIVLRGETIVTMTAEGAPPAKKEQKPGVASMGAGRAVGRGTVAMPGTGLPVPPPAPLPQHLMPGRGMPGIGRAPPMPPPGMMPPMGMMPPGMMPPMPGMMPPGRGMPFPPGMPPPMPGMPFPPMPGMPFPPGMPPMGRGAPPQ